MTKILNAIRPAGQNIIASDFQEKSYWWEAMPRQEDAPEEPLGQSADVAIVGGGVTGLNAAIELARAGRHVIVLDADRAGYGASSRNTGFLGRFLKKSLEELVKAHGAEKATQYYRELVDALNGSMVEVIERESIDCDLHFSGRVVLARSTQQLKGVVAEFELRRQLLGEELQILDRGALQREIRCSSVFCGGVLVPDMAAIHPGKYHAGLASAARRLGVTIADKARVKSIHKEGDGYRLETARGSVQARDVIVATNGYSGQELGWFSKRLVPFEGFAVATEELDPSLISHLLPTDRTYTDANFDTMAIRSTPDHRRLITSGRTGQRKTLREKARLLHHDLVSALPDLGAVKISYAWSGYCAAPFDTMPKIGQRADGVWYATGFTFMGMPQGSYFGRKVAFKLLKDPRMQTSYADAPFKSPPLYNGKPWFLKPYMMAMRAKDAIGNRKEGDDSKSVFPFGLF